MNATTDINDTATRTTRRRAAGWLAGAVVALALLAVGLILIAPMIGVGLPGLSGHDGEEIAEPDPSRVNDGLESALVELHGHTNWLVWGPGSAQLSPSFAELADETIVAAEEDDEQEIATLVATARDRVVRDSEFRDGHDLLQRAEQIAGGAVADEDAEEYVRDLQTD